MVFAWVLSTIVYMMTILAGEACEAAERFVTDQSFFNQVLAKFFPGAEYTVGKQLLSNCLFGDGDVLTALEAREPFEPYEEMFTALDNTTSLNESIQSAPGSITIPPQQFLVSQLQTGLISDSPETNTDLLSLNSFTNRRTNPCTEMQDTWVLNSANCTEEMGAIFTANSVAGFNIGNPTCIGFNIWGNRQIEERYNVETFPPICDEIGGMEADIGLGNFVNSFIVNRNQVENVFENVQVDLTAVSNANANLMNTITTTAANIASVREQTAGLYQLLGDRTTGVLRNSFCGFIKTSYAVFEDMLCVNFVTGVYRTMITVIITSFFGVFAMLALCCLSRRLFKENKLAKMVKNAGRQGIV